MKLVIFGLTITSSWGNGHATTYRSLVKALARRGHSILFVEKDVEWYRNARDLASPDFCSLRLYSDWQAEERALVQEARDADAIVVGSYFPDAIVATRALLGAGSAPVFFYDIDTPITMAHLRQTGRCEYLEASLIPHYAAYLSFTGGPALAELENRFHSPSAVALYCSVDPDLYRLTGTDERFRCDLSYLGTYAPDRQPSLMSLLNEAASLLPRSTMLVAGAKYPEGISWQPNVRRVDHVAPHDHPRFYSSSRFTLNLTRGDMLAAGYSPSVRLFEASACETAIVSDWWLGLDEFFTPGEEILLSSSAEETARILREISDEERKQIGRRARQRVLAEHTAQHRATQFEQIVSAAVSSVQTVNC